MNATFELRNANGNISIFTQDKLVELLKAGMLNPNLLVRPMGDTTWTEIKDFQFQQGTSNNDQEKTYNYDKTLNTATTGRPSVSEDGTRVDQATYASAMPLINEKHMAAEPPLAAKQYAGSKLGLAVVFFMAIAPFLGLFIRAFLIGANAPDYLTDSDFMDWMSASMRNGDFWYATLILNLLFLAIDFAQLKKHGVNAKTAFGHFFFLVPVYLYKRAKYFGINQVALIAWVVAFVVAQVAYR